MTSIRMEPGSSLSRDHSPCEQHRGPPDKFSRAGFGSMPLHRSCYVCLKFPARGFEQPLDWNRISKWRLLDVIVAKVSRFESTRPAPSTKLVRLEMPKEVAGGVQIRAAGGYCSAMILHNGKAHCRPNRSTKGIY